MPICYFLDEIFRLLSFIYIIHVNESVYSVVLQYR